MSELQTVDRHSRRPVQIPLGRALVAMILATGASSSIFASWAASEQNWGAIFALGWFFGLMLTLLFGVPAFLLLRNRIAPRAAYAALVGGLIPTLPLLLLNSLLFAPFPLDRSAIEGYGIFALLGAIGGLLFWAMVVGIDRSSRPKGGQ